MLEDAGIIVIDLETYDPYLSELGPGIYRKDVSILGAAVVSNNGFRKYYDLGHRGCTPETRARNRDELASILSNNVPKLGHNFMYDLDMLINYEGLEVNGRWEDTQIRESLLDAYAKHYDLDTLSKKYGGVGKKTSKVEQICERNGWKGPPQIHLYRMPASDVAEYALGDADATLFVWERQQAALEEQSLMNLYAIECRLTRPLLKMRKIGIRIDREKRKAVSDTLHQEYGNKMNAFCKKYGNVNINSPGDLTRVFMQESIPLVVTDKGNPSFAHDVLIGMEHPVAKEILDIRGLKTILNNFVDGAFIEYDTGGRIHATFYPVVRDEGGTVTGRFACRNPNLQQVPSKEEKYGPLIREIFIPEEDHLYFKIDYSQIEYRVLAHYAVGPGSVEIKGRFLNDPKTDYHQYVMDLSGLSRKYAKNLNFGTVYCMGTKTMSRKFGWLIEHAQELSEKYFESMPFIKPTRDLIIDRAKQRGYVRTILGRRARLTDSMRSRAGQRGKEYKLVNYLIQGSAADIMKASMVAAHEAGIFDVMPCHLTVHDELGNSMPKTKAGLEAALELKHIMETTVKLSVPVLADPEVGPNWGSCKEIDLKDILSKGV